MASETLTAISAMSGLDSFEQPDQKHPDGFLQMVSAPLQATSDLPKLKSLLYDKYKIEVPLIHWNGCKFIRVSVQGYNTRKDLGKLISALKENKNL
jgi:isopenicillin-N epimerase